MASTLLPNTQYPVPLTRFIQVGLSGPCQNYDWTRVVDLLSVIQIATFAADDTHRRPSSRWQQQWSPGAVGLFRRKQYRGSYLPATQIGIPENIACMELRIIAYSSEVGKDIQGSYRNFRVSFLLPICVIPFGCVITSG